MATTQTRTLARFMMAPAVAVLLIWMIVPLAMALYFSTLRFSQFNPERPFVGWGNYQYFVTDPAFWTSIANTLGLVGGVLAIAPFFVMPTVSALVWKNLLLDPNSGLLAFLNRNLGLDPVAWTQDHPMLSVIVIVGWEWMPFAALIFLTSLQSLSEEQREAAEMDGAGAISRFVYIILPHMARAITIVILIETIFLLGIYAEIFLATAGGPGTASTTLTYLVAKQSLSAFDPGAASAGGIIAVILANIVAIFLIRIVGKNIEA